MPEQILLALVAAVKSTNAHAGAFSNSGDRSRGVCDKHLSCCVKYELVVACRLRLPSAQRHRSFWVHLVIVLWNKLFCSAILWNRVSCSERLAYAKREERVIMDWKLELVAIPVSDVDRAKAFYTDKVDFNADHDHTVSDDIRFVQLTPPGSACSIVIGKESWSRSRALSEAYSW